MRHDWPMPKRTPRVSASAHRPTRVVPEPVGTAARGSRDAAAPGCASARRALAHTAACFLLALAAPAHAQGWSAHDVGGTVVHFTAHDALGGFEGRVVPRSLALRLDPASRRPASGRVVVAVDAIDTGNALRTINARRTVFDSGAFPTIHYAIEGIGLAAPLNAEPVQVEVTGTLDMHGQRHTLRLAGTVTLVRGRARGQLTGSVRLSDFSMSRPRFLTVVVDDVIDLRLALDVPLEPLATHRAPAGAR